MQSPVATCTWQEAPGEAASTQQCSHQKDCHCLDLPLPCLSVDEVTRPCPNHQQKIPETTPVMAKMRNVYHDASGCKVWMTAMGNGCGHGAPVGPRPGPAYFEWRLHQLMPDAAPCQDLEESDRVQQESLGCVAVSPKSNVSSKQLRQSQAAHENDAACSAVPMTGPLAQPCGGRRCQDTSLTGPLVSVLAGLGSGKPGMHEGQLPHSCCRCSGFCSSKWHLWLRCSSKWPLWLRC